MNKTIVGLIGVAAATTAALGCTQTAAARTPQSVLEANSFTELLAPIPSAAALLKASDLANSVADEKRSEGAGVQVAEHHHHHHYRRHRHHHHHHHHRRG